MHIKADDNHNYDKFTADKTLKFIGQQIIYNKFVLKSVRKQIKDLQKRESEAIQTIESLMRKADWELDKNPTLLPSNEE